ncbi:PREDICTED: ELKS/Rab6-interacting/CAST family member 1-like isoform X5 [Branchiostoma belcheri]|uniref:ELKS/Rab6-interacting/CAST family member 1-like isoform X5 n=1 Tax=Branchiostoma belcheri TaxID=7741 RepID=A0A6P4ZWY4_BRABE|nr:PREDICTED: ELKS/Rab6-interacting/CAST family member 1-like isoform X5 [Branchiostoma belcheri]
MYTQSRSSPDGRSPGSSGHQSRPGNSHTAPRPQAQHRSPSLGRKNSASSMSMENIQSLNAVYNTGMSSYIDPIGSPTHVPRSGRSSPLRSPAASGHSRSGSFGGSPLPARGSSPNLPASSSADTVSANMASQLPHSHELRQVRDNVMVDLQSQTKELQRENSALRKEIEIKEGKLQSSMNSIKTFWSPELKKERAIRKEEASRLALLKEQLRVTSEENQHHQLTIQALQDELRTQRDLNQLFQEGTVKPGTSSSQSDLDYETLWSENERKNKELFLLRKTVEELEIRIETQKQTLSARDESIKKLLEMLQSKGLAMKSMEEERGDYDRVKSKMIEAEAKVTHLESSLEQRDRDINNLKEELLKYSDNSHQLRSHGSHGHHHMQRNGQQNDLPKVTALQAIIESKEKKISQLEKQLREFEEDLMSLRSNGAVSSEEREEEVKQLEVYKSHSKFMKNKIDQLKSELNKKETEMLTMQTKVDTMHNQLKDQQQHIDVLKESLAAKEEHSKILSADIDSMRMRLEEKDQLLEKKNKQISSFSSEKNKHSSELTEVKDMMDIKERKITVLQRKNENLEEQLKDKDKQISTMKERVKSLQQDTSNSDSALITLEEALSEKERQIERLKSQRERSEGERQEEQDNLTKENKELKDKVETLQNELAENQSNLLDLKEHASSLASNGLKKDSRLKQLEIQLSQKTEEVNELEMQVKRQARQVRAAKESAEQAAANKEAAEKSGMLEDQVKQFRDEVTKSQQEVDRLLEILKETENEKHEKDLRIRELERQMRDSNKKLASIKHREQTEKKKNAQLLEEARKHADDQSESSQQMQLKMGVMEEKSIVRQKEDRIEELEEALRQSVNITAEREMLLAQTQAGKQTVEKQVDEMTQEIDRMKKHLQATNAKLASTSLSLQEKEDRLAQLRADRKKQLLEVMEMKQEALLAAISEKDANIALLELSSSKKKKTMDDVAALKREREQFVQQLKQQNQNRIKLMHDNFDEEMNGSSVTDGQGPSPDQHLQKGPIASPSCEQGPITSATDLLSPSGTELLSPSDLASPKLNAQLLGMLEDLQEGQRKLKAYIDHLVALSLEKDKTLLEGLPRTQQDQVRSMEKLKELDYNELLEEYRRHEEDNASLQLYADTLLQRIADHHPDVLERVVMALEGAG